MRSSARPGGKTVADYKADGQVLLSSKMREGQEADDENAPIMLGPSADASKQMGVAAETPPDHGPAHASKCEASGDGLNGGSPGAMYKFSVVANDIDGKRVKNGGDKVTCNIKPGDIEGAVADNGDGVYKITYTVPKAGSYSIAVLMNGSPIKLSPFPIFFHGDAVVSTPATIVTNGLNPATIAATPQQTPVGMNPMMAQMMQVRARLGMFGGVSPMANPMQMQMQMQMAAMGQANPQLAAMQMAMNPQLAAMKAAMAAKTAASTLSTAAAAPAASPNTVKISNLVSAITKEQLTEIFGNFGTIKHCNINGESALMSFETEKEAEQALTLSGMKLAGNQLTVTKEAPPPAPAPAPAPAAQGFPGIPPAMASLMSPQQRLAFQMLQMKQAATSGTTPQV